jgi:hypothetical protein
VPELVQGELAREASEAASEGEVESGLACGEGAQGAVEERCDLAPVLAGEVGVEERGRDEARARLRGLVGRRRGGVDRAGFSGGSIP